MANNYTTSVNVIIKNRSDTSDNWSKSNRILDEGEFGYDTTNKKFKIGDGSTAWNDLNYSPNVIDLSSYVPREDWNCTDVTDDNYYGSYLNMKELAQDVYNVWMDFIPMNPDGYPSRHYLGISEVAMAAYDLETMGIINGGSALTEDSEWNKYIDK